MEQADDIFQGLVGEQLSSVVFVQDYLQIDFDGNRLTLYIWPAVTVNGVRTVFPESDYRNKLCDLIAKIVLSTSFIASKALIISFGDDYKIEVPLNEDNPEIGQPEYFSTLVQRMKRLWFRRASAQHRV